MSKQKFFTGAISAALLLWLGLVDARAQAVYGTDYLSFEGVGVVLDNPTSPGCQSINVNFGSVYKVVYRWTANPSLVADALSFIIGDHAVSRLISTQSPNFSLNGSSTVTWTYINRHADFGNGVGATTTTMTILSGLNGPVTLGTGNIKIVNGNIPNFPANTTAGCTLTNFHAALVAIPN
jgi:hypothetical protein